jgi:hypothetical protein
MRFSLAGARSYFDSQYGSGHWRVLGIQLQLTAGNPGNFTWNPNSPGQFHIAWMQNDSWLEGTGRPSTPTTDGITYNSLQTLISSQDQDLGVFGFPGGTSGTYLYALGLASGLTSEVLAGTDADFRIFAADSSISYLFHSRSYIRDSSAHPVLSIAAVAVPEPGSAALVALGAALWFSGRFWATRGNLGARRP